MRVGLISDTHGLLRPQALDFLRGSDLIVHAGDIGGPEIVEALSAVAPTTAVRGNNDRGPWAHTLKDTASLQVGGARLCAIHDIAQLGAHAEAANARVIVFGHSHKPSIDERGGILLVNPGSAGPRRFKLPVSVAELVVHGDEVSARIVELPA